MTKQVLSEAAKRAATHCEALLKRQAGPAELDEELTRLGERVAIALRGAIAAAWNEPAIQLRSRGVRTLGSGELLQALEPLAANSLHGFGTSDRTLLLSIEGRALLEQLDRTFGGSGDIGGEIPAELPLSADLLAQRLEKQVMAVVSDELGGRDLRTGRREADVALLAPFSADRDLRMLELEVTAGGGKPWRIMLTLEAEALPDLLPRRPSSAPDHAARKSEPGDAPFADLPLTATATLVDMAVPLHRLAGLEPGTVLPIMVARNVPLKVGEVLLARGSIGEVDDQVALQITQTSSGKDSQ